MNSFVRLLFYCENVAAIKYMPMESTLKNKMQQYCAKHIKHKKGCHLTSLLNLNSYFL